MWQLLSMREASIRLLYHLTLVLTGGTYWLSVQVNMSFATGGQWFCGGNFGTTNIGNQYAW
jgi:hypothetical protein